MIYLYAKTFHLLLVISWFAGLFYLPRIFVNLAMVPADSTAERDRLILMSRKLYRFMNGLMMIAVMSGLVLVYFIGFGAVHAMGWLHAKLTLVALLIAYQLYCKHLLKQFEAGSNKRPHVWYRWFNEIPVLALVFILWFAVVKPF